MTIYDLGDGVNLRHLVYDRDDNLTDATVSLMITNLTTGTSIGVANSRTSLGTYDANTYVPPAAGDYRYKWTITGAITDISIGSFTVQAESPAYYSELPLVKNQIGKLTVDDRDEMIVQSIATASRMIDIECGYWPGVFRGDSAVSTRTFDLVGRVRPAGYNRSYIRLDPIASMTGLATSTGYQITSIYTTLVGSFVYGPQGALAAGLPIRWLQVYDQVLSQVDSIQVTARWGWPVLPSQIEMATRMLAARLYRRRDSPQGIITSADWGAVRVSRTDPDIKSMIFPFMTPGFA